MSSKIIYDRRFFKVGDNEYICLVCLGGVTEWVKRDIPVKKWECLSLDGVYRFSPVQFKNDVLPRFDKEYSLLKTRRSSFNRGEFERWFKMGIKQAHILDEVVLWNIDNALKVVYVDQKEEVILNTKRLNEVLKESVLIKNIQLVGRDFKPMGYRISATMR